MGEYAKFGGQSVKIGTRENMYYLRADQRGLVRKESGSLNPADSETLKVIRFRFPWPDEDAIEPGAFDKYDRGAAFNVTWPEPMDCEHGSIQFSNSIGLLASLPCPNGPGPHPVKIHRNGYQGDVVLTQTAFREGEWRVVCRCGACGYAYSVPRVNAEALAVAIRAAGDSRIHLAWVASRFTGKREDYAHEGAWWHTVADRVLAGYAPVEARCDA